MPIFIVTTNLPRDRVSPELGGELSRVLAEALNKPLKAINVTINCDVIMCLAGSSEPCAQMDLYSIGVLDEKRNPGYAKTLIEFVSTRLLIPHERLTLLFHPVERSNVGHVLYADMMKKS